MEEGGMTALPTLATLQTRLDEKLAAGAGDDLTYSVPGLWVDPADPPSSAVPVNPYRFYRDRLVEIEATPAQSLVAGAPGGDWSHNAVIYNLFVRTTTAFDHDGDGRLNLSPPPDGFRETGTFLKAVALLPLLRHLGINTVYLLPITAVGRDGNKGTLGSPYAIRNPYRLEESLAEPALGLTAGQEFKAFVEAAHHLGMRVVIEFVFRTSAKDGDWIAEHSQWFYWIRADVPDREPGSSDETSYGTPIFTPAELQEIIGRVEAGHRQGLIPPHETYRSMFTAPPEKVQLVDGRYIGTLVDGTRVRIPGAFADWPPDDPQPPWGDVTYLRMFDHPDFNYMAYNSVRMYDERLMHPRHVIWPLWTRIIRIIPHYQREYGIDGVMIDMGHALPSPLKHEIVTVARFRNPDFAFWDENFFVEQRTRDEGYNAVLGSYWLMSHRSDELAHLLDILANEGVPLPFFAAPETHNCPRAAARQGGVAHAAFTWALGCLLPTIPFVHSGLELGETFPINTGLDFSPEELARYPSHTLPLFSEYTYDWLRADNLTDWVRRTLAIRARYHDLIVDPSPDTLTVLRREREEKQPQGTKSQTTSQESGERLHVVAFVRSDKSNKARLAFIGNDHPEEGQKVRLALPTDRSTVTDLLTGRRFELNAGELAVQLEPNECLICEL
jgi:starch synthase (maltosyl-transferring)